MTTQSIWETESEFTEQVGASFVTVESLPHKRPLLSGVGRCLFAAVASWGLLGLVPTWGADFSRLPVTSPSISSDGTAVVGRLDRETSLLIRGEESTTIPLWGSRGLGLSADGQIAVGAVRNDFNGFPDREEEAAYWSSDDGLTSLGFIGLEVYRRGSYAVDTSDDGSVIVGTSSTVTSTNEDGQVTGSANQAFRWTGQTGMVGLGDLPGGSFESYAAAVSDDGSVIVGYSAVEGDEPAAFRWTAETGMAAIEDIAGGPARARSRAMAVSNDGSYVVGDGNIHTIRDTGEAFRWAASTGTVGLGHLPGHLHGMRSLRDVLISDFGLENRLAGWTLTTADDISPDGKTIVGTGLNLGNREGWIATIPEPSTFILLAVAGLVMIGRRHCHP